MSDKQYTQKEVLALLLKQKKSDADVLRKEQTPMTPYTASKKVLKNSLVLKKDAIQE